MQDKIKCIIKKYLFLIIIIFQCSHANAQPESLKDMAVPEAIRLSPYLNSAQEARSKKDELKLNFTDNKSFLNEYLPYISEMEDQKGFFLGYYNPGRQSLSNIQLDLYVFQKFLNQKAVRIPIATFKIQQPIWNE